MPIVRYIKQHTLVEVVLQRFTNPRCFGGGKQAGANVFRTDGVRLFRLVVFALVVAADDHRKAEANNESKQCQGSGQDNVKIRALGFFQRPQLFANEGADLCRKPQRDESQRENQKRKVHYSGHTEYLLPSPARSERDIPPLHIPKRDLFSAALVWRLRNRNILVGGRGRRLLNPEVGFFPCSNFAPGLVEQALVVTFAHLR